MTQLPAVTPSPLHPLTASWLSLADAARRLSWTDRHTRRVAAETWLAQGLARTVDGKWEVSSAADPALARTNTAVADESDSLAAVSEKQRTAALARKALLEQWGKHLAASVTLGIPRDRATADFCARNATHPLKPRRRTLYQWQAQIREASLAGLIDGRAKDRLSPTRDGDPFFAALRQLYCDQREKSIRVCHLIACDRARQHGWTPASYPASRRYLNKLPRPEVIQLRQGEKAFEDQCEPFIARDYSELETNAIWNADHHEFDVMVKVGEKTNAATGELEPIYGRPWLTAWQDLRSRRIVGHVIRDANPNTDAILAALRPACLEHGVPRKAYTDNGKDFDSYALTGQTKAQRWARRKIHVEHDMPRLGGIYAALSVEHIHAWPYHGQSKPIERFFGTLEDRFGRLWPTYFGSNPQNRPEDFDANLARGLAPTLEEFVARFEEWLEADYHNRIHTGDSMDCTPLQAYEANLHTKRTAPAELLELLLQRRIGPMRVGQNGVVCRNLWYGQHNTGHLFGKEVFCRVSDDLSRVSLWTTEDKFLCVAQANRALPADATPQQLAAAIAGKKSARKTMRAVPAARLRIARDIPDELIQASQAASVASEGGGFRPMSPQPNLMPIRSDLEGQLPAIRQGIELPLKKAVGDDTPMPTFNYTSYKKDATEGASGFVYRREDRHD